MVVKKRHRLSKMKQRRKPKRNREVKAAAIKKVESKSHDDFTPSDEDSSQSGGGDSEVDGTFVTGHLDEAKEGGEIDSASDNGLKAELQKGSLISEMVDTWALNNSLNTDVLAGDSSCLPSIPNENITEQSCCGHLPDGIQSNIFVKNKNNIWAQSNQSSVLKLESSSKETSTVFPNLEGEAAFARPLSESGAENPLLSNEKEGTIYCEHEIAKNERNARTVSFDVPDKQAHTSSHQSDDETDLLYVDNDVPSMTADNIQMMSGSGIDYFSTESVTKATVPNCVNIHPDDRRLCPSRKKGRYKRIFKLAPQFDIPRQIAIVMDEKLLQDVNLLTEQEDCANEETRKKNKQVLGYCGCPGPSSYDDVVESSPLDRKPLLCNGSKQLTEDSVDLPNNVTASPIQINTLASCKAPLSTEGQTATVDKTNQVNTEEKLRKISLDGSTTQPDILHSVNVIAEYLSDSAAENVEQMQQINETRPKKYSQTGGGQDSPSTKSNFLKLPLSLGFALQLVELFGSPGVPLDTLLPHDYIVPLDWETSEEIHLQWKTSVKKKRNKSQSKEDSSLPVGATALEDSNKDGQENQVSSEVVL